MTPHRQRPGPLRSLAAAVGVIAVVLLASQAVTSAATFRASTDNTGNSVVAGRIDVGLGAGSRPLLDGDNLVTGDEITGCVQVHYTGDAVPVEIRLTIAERSGHPMPMAIVIETRDNCRSETGTTVFEGTLAELWQVTGWSSGIPVLQPTGEGETVAVHATAVVLDDSPGGGVGFAAQFEARSSDGDRR